MILHVLFRLGEGCISCQSSVISNREEIETLYRARNRSQLCLVMNKRTLSSILLNHAAKIEQL